MSRRWRDGYVDLETCWICRAEQAKARAKELEEAARESLSLIDKDESVHARPTIRAVFAVQGILKRALREEEER